MFFSSTIAIVRYKYGYTGQLKVPAYDSVQRVYRVFAAGLVVDSVLLPVLFLFADLFTAALGMYSLLFPDVPFR